MSSINNIVSLLYKQIYFRIKIRFFFISWFSGSKTKLCKFGKNWAAVSVRSREKLRHALVRKIASCLGNGYDALLTEDSRHGYGLEAIRLENDFSFLLILYIPPLVPHNININKYHGSVFMRNIKTESFLSNLIPK